MKYSLLTCLISSSTLVLAQNPIEKDGWELTFNDEFNDHRLDTKKWRDSYYWGGRSNKDGLTYYDTDQLQFSDSTLLLIADNSPNKENLTYSSGMIDCSPSFMQMYGYFEVRSKNPKGTGFWPAFWLVSTASWPPEIDIYEFYTKMPDKIYTTTHWLNKRGVKKMQAKSYKKEDASEGFHIYAVEWTDKNIIWYYDNEIIRKSSRGVKQMIQPMHIIINLEVSEMKEMDLSRIVLPNALEVDYVRVYKKNQVD